MRKTRELWANMVNPQFGGPVFPVVVNVEVTGTATDTIPVFVATRDVALRRASIVQEVSPDGQKTLNLRNLTDSEDLATAVDSDALAANTGEAFVLASASDSVDEGDVIGLVYTVATAGTTAPGVVTVVLELELLELKNT